MELPNNQPNYQQQPMAQGQQPYQQPPEKKTDVLGIISLVMIVTSLHLVGFIVGLVGASKAKKEGRSPTLSRVGWIINLVLMILVSLMLAVFLAVPGLQRSQRNTMKKNDLVLVSSELESYYSQNRYYPPTLNGFEGDYPGEYTYTVQPAGCERCESYFLEIELEGQEGFPYQISSSNQ